ncbi:hypothetical protein EPN42_10870 [bacterium]|nr:MAG: hypothetical protein EPN42_10870 [bacterium]
MVPNAAIRDASVPGEIRLTFFALKSFQYGDSPVRVSMTTLARAVGCSDQTVRRHLRHLEQLQWIRSFAAGVGRGLVYQILLGVGGRIDCQDEAEDSTTPITRDRGTVQTAVKTPITHDRGDDRLTDGTPITDDSAPIATPLSSVIGGTYHERQGSPVIGDSPSNTLSNTSSKQQQPGSILKSTTPPALIAQAERFGLTTAAVTKILRRRGVAWLESKLLEIADRSDIQHPGKWLLAAADGEDVAPSRQPLRHPNLPDAARDQLQARRIKVAPPEAAQPTIEMPVAERRREEHPFLAEPTWMAFTEALRSRLSDPAFYGLAQPLTPTRWGVGGVVLLAPNGFARDMALSRIREQLLEAARIAFGVDVPLEIALRQEQAVG